MPTHARDSGHKAAAHDGILKRGNEWTSNRLDPFLTGAAGGLFTLWLMKRWARFVPRAYQNKSAKQLLVEYRTSLISANVLLFGTIAVGIYIFKAGLVRIPANAGH